MLPGFRFLFAAIVLSMSLLIFGLGAAALMRSAHEEVASLPSRRAPAEQTFTRPTEEPMPTLALLRVDPPVADEKPLEDVPSITTPETLTPVEPTPEAKPAEREKVATFKSDEPASTPEARPAVAGEVTTAVAPVEALPLVVEQPAKVAAAPVAEVAIPPVSVTDARSIEDNPAATKIATLGGPAVVIDEKTTVSTTEAKPDRSEVKKRNAQRARERRRIAARRARLAAARQAAAAAQQANPFGQTTTARTQ